MTNSKILNSSVIQAQLKKDLPYFTSGSIVSVHNEIVEGTKKRVQIFKGIVTKIHRKFDNDASFTVLKVAANNIKVKRVFSLHSPSTVKIVVDVAQRGRRATLNYLENLKSPEKAIRAKKLTPKVAA